LCNPRAYFLSLYPVRASQNTVFGFGSIPVYLEPARTHKALVESCQRGNRKAQFELYSLYSRAMYNVCLRMVKNEFDAEDVLQNAFVDIFSKMGTFRFESSIGAWIKRIVINHSINFLKQRRLNFEVFDDQYQDSIPDAVADEDYQNIALNVEQVKKALHALPDGYRVVFSLYLLEGYDHQEIAGILGINEATSKSQYSRAKHRIREILRHQQGRTSI
jgi:RNA polymerase sigma-70 factor (ECF subfamily)